MHSLTLYGSLPGIPEMDDQLPSKRGALRRSAVVEMDGLLYQYLKRAAAVTIPYFF